MAFDASRRVAQLIMKDKPVMDINTNAAGITTVGLGIEIEKTDLAFFQEVIRRMGNIALAKVLRYKYPFLDIGQASEMAKAIRDMPE